jgi:DNA-binding MarR family transcriptional regulator
MAKGCVVDSGWAQPYGRMLDPVKDCGHNWLMTDADDLGEARELADALLRAGFEIQHKLGLIAARHDLTVQQVMFLRFLEEPIAMSTLADAKGCDPSNVTGLVDRIARLGLVQRLPDPDDRRVRLLSLTAKGKRIRDRVDQELARDISKSFDGTASQQAELKGLLSRM